MNESRNIDTLASILAAIACVFALAWLQFGYPALLDGDSYFHTRAAQQLHEHGIEREFPQAHFSTWSERYSDKDLLFHAFLIPFCHSETELLSGGKLAVVCLNALIFAALVLAMSGLGIRYGALWSLLFLSASPWLVQHLLAARPHLLALVLLELEILCLLTGRWKSLGALSALHVLAHSSWILLPGLPIALAIAQRVRAEAIPWRALAGVAAGILLATLLHPYFPNNLSLGYDQIIEVARNAWSASPRIPHDLFGGELDGIAPWTFVSAAPIWLPAVVGLFVLSSARSVRSMRAATLTLGILTGGFLLLTFLSSRFFVFFALFAVLLAGSAWSEVSAAYFARPRERRSAPQYWMAAGFVVLCIVTAQVSSNVFAVRNAIAQVRIPVVYRNAIEHLDSIANQDDGVFHASWQPFSWLYHFRPNGRYVEGLDPVFLYRFDADLFDKMLAVYRGSAKQPHAIIHGDFDASWIFVAKLERTRPMRDLLSRAPFVTRVYVDEYAEVHRVDTKPGR
jgi:hypothetical protein